MTSHEHALGIPFTEWMEKRRACRRELTDGQGSIETLYLLAALEGVSPAALERELATDCGAC